MGLFEEPHEKRCAPRSAGVPTRPIASYRDCPTSFRAPARILQILAIRVIRGKRDWYLWVVGIILR